MFEQEHLALRQRQLALKLRSAELRASLAEQIRQVEPVLTLVDRALAVLRGVRQRWERAAPIWRVLTTALSAAATLGLLRRPARVLRVLSMLSRAAGLWTLFRGWQDWRASKDQTADPGPVQD
jgi:hypothetical protein